MRPCQELYRGNFAVAIGERSLQPDGGSATSECGSICQTRSLAIRPIGFAASCGQFNRCGRIAGGTARDRSLR